MSRKFTRKNPGDNGYRMPIMGQDEIRIQISNEIPQMFGTIVDIIGKLEEVQPLEDWLQMTKK